MSLLLTDILAPQFLCGPLSRIRFIPFLEVSSFNTCWNDDAIVYSGVTSFKTLPSDLKDLEFQQHPLGPVFHPGAPNSLTGLNILFRLTIPRRGSTDVSGPVNSNSALSKLKPIFADLGEVPLTVKSEYPGTAFRLELLFRTLTLRLPASFLPATVDQDGMLVQDGIAPVEILLPNIALQVSQEDKWADPKVSMLRWGVEGLDDLFDCGAGQLVSMQPAWTIHNSLSWGFGFESAILDLSDKITPAAILAQFGVGDDFQGLYFPQVRLYAAPKSAQGLEFALYANDLLIDFKNGVSGEFGLDIEKPGFLGFVPAFSLSPTGAIVQTINKHKRILSRTATSMSYRSRVDLNSDLDFYLTFPIYQGGVPPYTVTVSVDSMPAVAVSSSVWKIPRGTKLIRIVGNDSSAPPLLYSEIIRVEPTAKVLGNAVKSTGLVAADSQPMDQNFYLKPVENLSGVSVSPGALVGGLVKIPYIDPTVKVHFEFKAWDVTYPSVLLPNGSTLKPIPYPSATPPTVADIKILLTPVNWTLELQDPAIIEPAIILKSFYQEFEANPAFGNPFQAKAAAQADAQARADAVKVALVQCGVNASRIQTQVGSNGNTNQSHEVHIYKQIHGGLHTIHGSVGFEKATKKETTITRPKSDFFRGLHLRIRLERNKLVMFEIGGTFDFKTAAERARTAINPSPAALFPNKDDGLTKFRVTITHDTATKELTEEFALMAAGTDLNGLWQTQVGAPQGTSPVNGYAAFLAVAPLLADASPSSAAGPMTYATPAAVGLALAAAIQNSQITLYGGEARSTQSLGTVKNLQIFFDYGITFGLNLNLGGFTIATSAVPPAPVTVRYKAVGAELNFRDSPAAAAYFDPSKGYEFGLADPGQLTVGFGANKIITATAFRVARLNPVVLEADLTLNLNLGVVSVDSFRVTAKFDGDKDPDISIQGIGVSIDIPGAIKGRGYLKFLPDGGIEGSLDLMLVATKLRVSASVRVKCLRQVLDRHESSPARKFEHPLNGRMPALGATGTRKRSGE